MMSSGAIIPPILGGVISLVIWRKKIAHNQEQKMLEQFSHLNGCIIELTEVTKKNSQLLNLQHEQLKEMKDDFKILDKRMWDLNDRGNFR